MFPWDTAKNSDIRFRDTAVWFSADIPLWVGVNYSLWCTCVRTWVPDGGTVLGCKKKVVEPHWRKQVFGASLGALQPGLLLVALMPL